MPVPPNDLQLSALPYNSPATLALHAARLVRRIERIALALHPFESLWVLGDLSLVDMRLDKIEAHLLATHRLK